MKGKKYQQKSIINSNNKNNKNYDKDKDLHINELKFCFDNNGINGNNITNLNIKKNQKDNRTKNVRNLSQKPMRPTKNDYPNNFNYNNVNYNNYNNNINYNNPANNFMIKNSNPFAINQNQIIFNNNKNRNPKLLPINTNNQKKILNNNIKAKSKDPKMIKSKNNKNINNNLYNNNDKIKIKLDEKGVYICDDEEYENPDDAVNELNVALQKKNDNNLQISQEEKTMIETIKKVSSNRVKYRNTHQMLKEIGNIMKDPLVNFLIKKEPIESKNDSPSDKLSQLLSQKLLEEQKRKLIEVEKEKERNEEENYYENLQKRIKEEIRQKKSFDFSKLTDKEREILVQRKLYNKIGKKIYEDNGGNNVGNDGDNSNNNNNGNACIGNNDDYKNKLGKEEINQIIDKKFKNEINREDQKENFFQEIERYNNEDDDYFNIGKINNKDIIVNDEQKGIENNNNEKEKPTARGILEKVLNKIEYKNQQLINHNEEIDRVNMKNDYNKKKMKKFI